jgi:hypothetical protein
MYTVWNVTFRIKTDNRGPCDPLYRMEPLARGGVGDADPFSDAFGRVLTNVEDSLNLRSTRYEQASSATSDTSDFLSLQSSMQDSPFTPNTAHSTFSRSDGLGSMTRQLYHQPISPNLDYYTGKIDSMIRPPTSTDDLNSLQDTLSEATAKLKNQGDNTCPQPAPSSTPAPSASRSKAGGPHGTKRDTKPSIKRKRKKKAPFSMTRRPPVKTRAQHLSDNKAAASRCRKQRKEWETHLQDVSLVLKASIDTSKSDINELGNELATLKRQVWECPGCVDRYVYSRGLDPNGINSDKGSTDTLFARSDTPLA